MMNNRVDLMRAIEEVTRPTQLGAGGPYIAELMDESDELSPVAVRDRDGHQVAFMSQDAFRAFRELAK